MSKLVATCYNKFGLYDFLNFLHLNSNVKFGMKFLWLIIADWMEKSRFNSTLLAYKFQNKHFTQLKKL